MRRREFIQLLGAAFVPDIVLASQQVEIIPYEGMLQQPLIRVQKAIEETYGFNTFIGDEISLPQDAYFAPRERYYGLLLIEQIEALDRPWFVMGITNKDIYEPNNLSEHWGVMGVARPNGLAAIISTHRMRNNWLQKAAVHELGHNLLGKEHCENNECQLLDIKGKGKDYDKVTLGYFCPRHAEALRAAP